jgi:hypothetical protein
VRDHKTWSSQRSGAGQQNTVTKSLAASFVPECVQITMGFHGSRYLRFLKRRHIRASVESTLDAANAVPNSGFTFVENSQGASAAASELSRTLDTAIEQVDLEGTVQSGLWCSQPCIATNALLITSQEIWANSSGPSCVCWTKRPPSSRIPLWWD